MKALCATGFQKRVAPPELQHLSSSLSVSICDWLIGPQFHPLKRGRVERYLAAWTIGRGGAKYIYRAEKST